MRHPEDGARPGPTEGGHPDEGTIHAWLDGQLSAGEAGALQEHLDGCADCRAAVAEARGLVAASRRVLQALDEGPGGVHARPADAAPSAGGPVGTAAAAPAEDDLTRRRRSAPPPRRGWRVPAMAAVAVLAVGTTLVVQRSGPPPALVNAEVASREAVSAPVEPPSPPVATAAAADEVARSEPPVAAGSAAAQPTIAADRSTNMERALTVRQPTAADAGASRSPDAAATPGAELKQAPPIVRPPPELASTVAAAAGASPPAAAESVPAPSPAPIAAAPRALGARAGMAAETVVSQSRLAFQGDAVSRQVGPVIAGRVLGSGGEPLAEAQVTVADLGRGVATDAAGRFRLADMPTGDHWMLVQKQGFQPMRLPLRVSADGDSVLVVSLALAVPGPEGVVAQPGQGVPAPVPVALPPVAPGALTEVARRLAGCYRLELGGAISEGRELAEEALPGWLHLRPTPAATAGWLVAEPVVTSAGQEADRQTRWRTLPDSEVEVAWPTSVAATEVLLRLRGMGEVLTGTAALRQAGSDTIPGEGEEEVASVVFVRSVCSG